MAKPVVREGKLRMQERYFAQNRDKAMRGEIERALVELITNADDSYRDLEDSGGRAQGKIRIEIGRRRAGTEWTVVVRDRAGGMSPDDMEEKLTRPGAETSGFEKGHCRRGLHGRGAKDVTHFGPVVFESIKDGQYAKCCIRPSTEWRIEAGEADAAVRERLGIPRGNGTVVTLQVASQFKAPHHATMVQRFPRYFALRDIFANPARIVTLVDLNARPRREDRILYRQPDIPRVKEDEFQVPGYQATARLTIYEHPEPFRDEKHRQDAPYRMSGVEVKSGAAIHEVTLFSFENDPYAQRLCGCLQCAHIDVLVREFDARDRECPGRPQHPESNPIRLLSPDRDGLIRQHPFARALYAEAERRIGALVQERQTKAEEGRRRIESALLRSRLDALEREAARFLEDEYRKMDEAREPGREAKPPPEGLSIVPSDEYPLPLGTVKTFSVVLNAPALQTQPEGVRVVSDSDGIRILDPLVSLRDDAMYQYVRRATFRVEGAKLGAEGFVSASANGEQAVVLIEVVEPPPEAAEDVPVGLSFEREAYELPWGKQRTVKVRFRPERGSEGAGTVSIKSDSPHIVVTTASVRLREGAGRQHWWGPVSVVGRQLHAKGVLSATLGDRQCSARIRVVQKGGSRSLQIKPVDRDHGVLRAVWRRDEPNVLEVAGRHPAIRPYLGAGEQDFPGKDSREYAMLLAEVVAEALCQRVLQKREEKLGGDEGMTVDAFYTEHNRLMREFLPRAQRVLVPPEPGT